MENDRLSSMILSSNMVNFNSYAKLPNLWDRTAVRNSMCIHTYIHYNHYIFTYIIIIIYLHTLCSLYIYIHYNHYTFTYIIIIIHLHTCARCFKGQSSICRH